MFGVTSPGRIGPILFISIFLVCLFSWITNSHARIEYVPDRDGIFIPSSAWLVGPAVSPLSRQNQENKTCVMANQYDNGFVVRLAGGDQNLMAMSVDFRQNVFVKGDNYNVMLMFHGGPVITQQALAHAPGTLVIDLRQYPEVYKALGRSDEVTIKVAETGVRLSLAGVAEGLERLENCFAPVPDNPSPQKPGMQMAVAKPASVTAPELLPAPLPEPPAIETPATDLEEISEANDIVAPAEKNEPIEITAKINWDGDKVAVVNREDLDTSEIAPVTKSSREDRVMEILRKEPFTVSKKELRKGFSVDVPDSENLLDETQPVVWRARKGEDIKRVLSQWSQIAGYDFVWQTGSKGNVKKDFLYEGGFEKAVAKLISESGGQDGISAHIEERNAGAYEMAGNEYTQPASKTSGRQWHAMKGTDMRNTLRLWAREAGVELVWASDVSFQVKEAINVTGNFESALEAILLQFQEDELRPLGTIHNDSRLQKRFLVIQSARAS